MYRILCDKKLFFLKFGEHKLSIGRHTLIGVNESYLHAKIFVLFIQLQLFTYNYANRYFFIEKPFIVLPNP